MKKTEIMGYVTRNLNRVGLHLKKHSPEILLVAGIAGAVTSAVMACKATTKVSKILEETKDQVDKVHGILENEDVPEKMYSEEDAKKDLTIIYAQAGLKFVKLYGPSIALGALSLTSILASHNLLHKRNVALAAAYTAVDTGFKNYRSRVVERFGNELDRELRHNLKSEKIEETVVDEDGVEKTIDKSVDVTPGPHYSEYARFYDDGCTGWSKDASMNLMFLIRQQDYANERLKAKGHLFLNEVYDMLGIPRSRAGQIVGWLYDPRNSTGDNFGDFGIHDLYKQGSRDFVNGYERTILLDFNVDGNIMDLI